MAEMGKAVPTPGGRKPRTRPFWCRPGQGLGPPLVEGAVADLTRLGERAAPLKELALYLLERRAEHGRVA